ncbi:hypothetical protein D3C83_145130 [compost metagenome]
MRSCGFTCGLISFGIDPWKGTFTKLKKYKCPIQMIPAKMCIQRKKKIRFEYQSSSAIGSLHRKLLKPKFFRISPPRPGLG